MQRHNYTDWLFSCISISEGKNYLLSNSGKLKKILGTKIKAKFEGNIGTTENLWLRKEIVRELL